MQLTLGFIVRHCVLLQNCSMECSGKQGNHGNSYHQVLLGDELTIGEPGTLYVTDALPNEGQLACKCGYIVLGSGPDCDVKAKAEVLYVSGDLSLVNVFNEVAKLFSQYSSWEIELGRIASAPNALQGVCDFFFEKLGNPSYYVDSNFKVLAMRGNDDAYEMGYVWKHLVDEGYMPWAVIEQLIERGELPQIESSPAAMLVDVSSLNTPFVNLVIRRNGARQGNFFVVGMFRRLDEDDALVVGELGRYIADALMGDEGFLRTRGLGYEHFMSDVINGELKDPLIVFHRAELLGLNPEGDFAACVFDATERNELLRAELLRNLEGNVNCKPFVMGDVVVAVTQIGMGHSYDWCKRKMRSTAKRLKCKAALSELFTGFANLPSRYWQAITALECGDGEGLTLFPEVYFEALGHNMRRDLHMPGAFICHEALLLLDHDAKHGTEYARTLLGYVVSGRNSVRAAEAMHMHRSTLTYRLEKIEALCGIDLNDDRWMLACALSIALSESISA